MKHLILTLLVMVSVIACSPQPAAPGRTTSNTVPGSTITSTTTTITPPQGIANDATEEAAIRNLVENFGTRIQHVSLLASDAAQQMQKQYSDFVSPTLLETWMSDVSKAPGRTVSSPWPDRIEITTLAKEAPDRYVITGFVVEVTSVEMVNGGAAAKIPVRVVVQKDQSRWLITEYAEER
jgi:hypothetical protein